MGLFSGVTDLQILKKVDDPASTPLGPQQLRFDIRQWYGKYMIVSVPFPDYPRARPTIADPMSSTKLKGNNNRHKRNN